MRLPLFSLLSVFLLPSALALPDVTAVPATGGCSVYPGFDTSTGIAGPWGLVLSQPDNSSIENFGASYQVRRRAGDTGIRQGRLTIGNRVDLAKVAIRCNAANGALEGLTPTGVSGAAWNQVNITDIPYDAELGWGWGQYSTAVEPYYHYVDDVKQDGLFLGQASFTAWGVTYATAEESDNGLPYYNLRLLGENSAIPWLEGKPPLLEGETRAFLKVQGS